MKKNLLFFHHVFELCYYFIPVGLSSKNIFQHLLFLYRSDKIFDNICLQKLFVGKLLFMLGVYPPEKLFNESLYVNFVNLFSKPIDMLVKLDIDLEYKKKLNFWLLGCVNVHPCVGSFKTVHFLRKMENHETS